MVADKTQEKKFMGLDSGVVAVSGLFIAITGALIILAAFAFNTLRADIARVEAVISEMRAENRLNAKIDSASNRLDAKIDRVDGKIDNLADRIDSRLDDVEREQSRLQGAFETLSQTER